jgi:hypothetical protein
MLVTIAHLFNTECLRILTRRQKGTPALDLVSLLSNIRGHSVRIWSDFVCSQHVVCEEICA